MKEPSKLLKMMFQHKRWQEMLDKATEREEIWHWFDEYHSKGVGWLMNEFEG